MSPATPLVGDAIEVVDEKYDEAFPLSSMDRAARHLRRPFTPAAVKWKVQSAFGDKGCLIVPYIDARLVIERLNLICPSDWAETFTVLDKSFLGCELTVCGVTHRDVGQGNGKGLYSDAFKRAAVKFGIGVSLYAIPKVTIWRSDEEKAGMVDYRQKDNKHEYHLTPSGERGLREWYHRWLEMRGEKDFGPALDHGDAVDEQTGAASGGDPDDVDRQDAAVEEGAPVALVEGERADALRQQATDAYSELVRIISRSNYPPASFQQGLASAGGSIEELEAFVDGLEAQLAEAREARTEARAS